MRNWQLRPELFRALWTQTGQDRVPNPFDIVSTAATRDEFESEQKQLGAAYTGREHDALTTAFRVLAEPEVYVEITGESVDRRPIRIIGGQLQRWSAIAVQLPGSAPRIGGDVLLGAGPSGRLSSQLIGQIPQNASGNRQFQPLHAGTCSGFEHAGGVLRQAGVWDAAPRFDVAVRKSYAGRGKVRVFRGPRYGKGRDVGAMAWLDLAGDGRYVIGPRDLGTAQPAGPTKLVSTLDALIADGVDAFRNGQDQGYW